jgi:hypothetical protein
MKARFFLALLALNGLFFSANSASAFTGSSTEDRHNIANLSRTIAELVEFDPDTHSLVEMAISRALIAQKAGNAPDPQVAGGLQAPNFSRDPFGPPIVGTIAIPNPPPTVNGTIANPNPPQIDPRPKPVNPQPPHPDRELKRTIGTVMQLQPLAPDLNKPIDRENVTPKLQSTDKIDRSANTKKLSECNAPMSDNTNALPVNHLSNPLQPTVTLDKIVKPSTLLSTPPTDKVAAPTPTPPVRHFVGARG